MSTKTNKKYIHADEQDDSQIGKNKIGDFKSFIFLFQFAKPYKWSFILSIFLVSVSSMMSALSARFMGLIVEDGLIAKAMMPSIIYSVLIVLIGIISIWTLWFGRKILSEKASFVVLDIRKKLFFHLQELPLKYYDRQPQGRIVTRLTHDVEGLENFFTSSMGRLLHAIVLAFILVIAMLATHFKIGALLILSMVPAILFVFSTKGFVRKAHRKMSKMSSQLNSGLSENLDAIGVIRIFGLESWSGKKYEITVSKYLKSLLHANMLFATVRPFNLFLCTIPLLVMVGYGGKLVLASLMGVGLFVSFIRYCERFFHPIFILVRELHVIQSAFTSAERIVAFLKEATEYNVLGKNGSLGCDKNIDLTGEISFKNVSMAYDESDNWVLKNISFCVESGQKIGLVGTTGCGKTTTVSLLLRLYEYQKGDILIDNRSIEDYNRSFLRQSVGFVSQDVIIYKGTLRENLDAEGILDDLKIISACFTTGLISIMKENSITLDSVIFEGGTNVSVGERQLIAITRILLRDPKILIMDEATSNIDPKYEKIIHNAVKKTMKNRTCLIIAHRLETLEQCDRILVFKEGKIAEEGTRSNLLKTGTVFKELYKQSLNQRQDNQTEVVPNL